MRGWLKLVLFAVIVILPAIAVGIGNYYVFPQAFWITTIMLSITVAVAAILSYASSSATPKIARYAVVSHLILCAVLCANLIFHVVIGRELSSVHDLQATRHAEEDREQLRKDADTRREAMTAEVRAKELAAQSAVIEQTRKLNYGLKAGQRQAAPILVNPVAVASVDPLAANSIKATPTPVAILRTEEEVREGWRGWLLFIAALEVAASVLSAGILASIWEWDKNGNGIDDELEAGVRNMYNNTVPKP